MKQEPAGSAARDRRRRLGAYYTPDNVAALLVNWALPEPGFILDPSFGGCSFLRASLARQQELGAASPGINVFGVDVDRESLRFARDLFVDGVPPENILIEDFFTVRPGGLKARSFDAVVGNPPYIRHHWLDARLRARAASIAKDAGFVPSGRSSAWAYFLVHATSFLKTGGRMAFLLPGSALNADYAWPLLDFLAKAFGASRLVRIVERLFEAASETTVLLLCQDYGRSSGGGFDFCEVSGLVELEALLSQDFDRSWKSEPITRQWRAESLPAEVRRSWDNASKLKSVHELGSLAELKIGVVTGANSFFVRSRDEVDQFDNSVQHVPVVTRGRWLRHVFWSSEDQDAIELTRAQSRLLLFGDDSPGTDAEQQLSAGRAKGLDSRLKCRSREPWYAVEHTEPPDALLPYMGSGSPTISLNRAAATCTNAIHRIWWKDEGLREPEAIATGSWTSLFALSSEIHGRSYGGGVLKLEPSEAKRCLVPMLSGAKELAENIDALARAHDFEGARRLADRVILMDGLGLSAGEVATLKRGESMLADKRKGKC